STGLSITNPKASKSSRQPFPGEHGPSGHHRSRITEPEKTVLRRATPVARERAPTGANPHPAAARRIEEKAAHADTACFMTQVALRRRSAPRTEREPRHPPRQDPKPCGAPPRAR